MSVEESLTLLDGGASDDADADDDVLTLVTRRLL